MDVVKIFSLFLFYFHSIGAETSEITQSGEVGFGGNVTLHIEVKNMRRTVVWKNDNARYECDFDCYDFVNYKVTHSGNTSNLLIRNVSQEDLHWRFCEYYGCHAKYTLVIKDEETKDSKEVNGSGTSLDNVSGTSLANVSGTSLANGSGTSLPTSVIVVLSIVGLVAISLITFLVIFKCNYCKKIKCHPLNTLKETPESREDKNANLIKEQQMIFKKQVDQGQDQLMDQEQAQLMDQGQAQLMDQPMDQEPVYLFLS